MQTKNIFIVHPVNEEQELALKAFVKALKIKFEVANEQTCNPAMVAKIKKSRKEFEHGKFTTVEKDNLEQFLGLK